MAPKNKQSQRANKPVFFWKPEEPSGQFCQWYPSNMVDEEGQTFSCCEQYMMYHKAKTFNDTDTMRLVLSESDPQKHKALGRAVKGLTAEEWDKVKFEVVKKGNTLKFGQNAELKQLLFDTEYRELVEASRFDKVWGIGFTADKAVTISRDKWGQNLLGKALMEVRDELLAEDRGGRG